jgi:hypothetical protein
MYRAVAHACLYFFVLFMLFCFNCLDGHRSDSNTGPLVLDPGSRPLDHRPCAPHTRADATRPLQTPLASTRSIVGGYSGMRFNMYQSFLESAAAAIVREPRARVPGTILHGLRNPTRTHTNSTPLPTPGPRRTREGRSREGSGGGRAPARRPSSLDPGPLNHRMPPRCGCLGRRRRPRRRSTWRGSCEVHKTDNDRMVSVGLTRTAWLTGNLGFEGRRSALVIDVDRGREGVDLKTATSVGQLTMRCKVEFK